MTIQSVGRRVHRQADGGFALLTTVLVMAMLAAISLVVLQQALNNTTASRKDQDWVAALGAAQAGLDDYLSRMNDTDGAYFIYRTSAPDPANAAMGTVAGGGPRWAPVPTAGGEPARASFHYDVDTSTYTGTGSVSPNGNILVESTGKVGVRTRTIKAVVRRSGFVDFVYFTDFETQDPLNYPPAQRASATANCANYWGLRAASCTDIIFQNDNLSGPVHSNDTMYICNNVTFTDKVTTMSGPVTANGGRAFRRHTGSGGNCSEAGTTFTRPGDPLIRPKVDLPSTNLGLKLETSAAANPRGCLYVGPTKIVINKTQIQVTSPWTRTITPGCPKDVFFPIPVSGVIYVDVSPGDGIAGEPNSWTSTDPLKPVCPVSGTGNNVGYPIAGETNWVYSCKAGDVFIEELDGNAANALNGRLTVSANNDVYVTNHIDYLGGTGGTAFLGLIAEQFVYLWHPIKFNGNDSAGNPTYANLGLTPATTPFINARVSAALLSVKHAVTTMSYDKGGSLGTLNMTGAITQKFRGIVRQGTSGYAKNYVYDQRLRYDSPPKFLNPTVSSFSPVRTSEQSPKYRG